MKNRKVNFFNICLMILLILSLTLYYFLFVREDKSDNKIVDLPNNVTNIVWYESNSLETIRFSSGNFEYNGDKFDLSTCKRYYYNEKDKVIEFNCDNYKMKLISVTDYKLIVVISGKNMKSDVYTYYSSLDLVNYLIDSNIKNISNDDIKEIVEDNDFSISKIEDTDSYKNIQISKLSSINELSIDEYLTLEKMNEKAVVLLISPNMSVDLYDFIPVFLEWNNVFKDYNFYYVNGLEVVVSDEDLLEENEVLKDYLLSSYECNILILEDNEFKRYSVDISVEESNNIFNCILDDCFNVDIKIYDRDKEYKDIKELLDME